MKAFMRALGTGLVCVSAVMVSVAADDVRTILEARETGLLTIEQRCSAGDRLGSGAGQDCPRVSPPERGEVIWHNTLTDAIYQSTAISMVTGCLCAGTYLNPPQEAEWIPLEGDGTPDWVFPGTDFRVAASRYGEVIAGVDKWDTSVTLYKWHPGSSVPDWSYEIPSASVGGVRALVVSPDASTIALVVTMQNPQRVRLYCFAPDSPDPIAGYDAPEGTWAGNIDITADGRFIAFYAAADAYVFDRDADALRWSGPMGGGNTPLAISGDGQYLAYGWMSLFVRQWNGSAYTILWTIPGGDFWLKSCRFSLDAGTFVAGWCDYNTYLQNKIQLFEMPVGEPLWTYLYQFGAGGYRDVPYEIAVTWDGGHVAVASLGDQANTNPEIHVFEHAAPDPILTVDTPGSIFTIDIAEDARGSVYIAAGGKHVHAEEFGRGGDLYSIRLNDPGAVGDADAGSAPLTLQVSPNPFRRSTTIRLAQSPAERPQLRVYSAGGRLVRTLDPAPGEALLSLSWDGRTQAGRPVEPGVYFLRLEAGNRLTTRRIVRVE